jgi:hypothetical protein
MSSRVNQLAGYGERPISEIPNKDPEYDRLGADLSVELNREDLMSRIQGAIEEVASVSDSSIQSLVNQLRNLLSELENNSSDRSLETISAEADGIIQQLGVNDY